SLLAAGPASPRGGAPARAGARPSHDRDVRSGPGAVAVYGGDSGFPGYSDRAAGADGAGGRRAARATGSGSVRPARGRRPARRCRRGPGSRARAGRASEPGHGAFRAVSQPGAEAVGPDDRREQIGVPGVARPPGRQEKLMARDVWVLHGPNLGLLGRREPRLYGKETLESIDRRLVKLGEALGLRVASFQTNHEGALIDRLTMAMDEVDGCLLNPAAFSHTSLALADTLRSMTIPVVEVHMTNLYARERERQESVTGSAATGVIMGFGPASYELGLHALAAMVGGARG